ncbi:thiaminase II, partial [Campylobacter upsaliensis]|nr:thiaminase II [Campylobacter upsaliensis]
MLFQKLLKENSQIWDSYLHHDFVKQLENGTLKSENFLFYLKQDYIYLIHYAKCYALLALNANNAKELRFAMKFQNYIVEGELELHKSILKLGIDADKLSVKDESLANIAYTRYMLSVGQSGDYLDLLVALSACAIGY